MNLQTDICQSVSVIIRVSKTASLSRGVGEGLIILSLSLHPLFLGGGGQTPAPCYFPHILGVQFVQGGAGAFLGEPKLQFLVS